MDALVVGIDVSKDRLDVHVAPSGEAFCVGNDHSGVEALAARLGPLGPQAVALEATGGFETLAVAALTGAGLPVIVVTRRRCALSPARSASVPRAIRSMRA